MVSYLLVGAGAFIGGVLRYAVSVAMRVPADSFPWHTFVVNAVGCLAAGVAMGALSGKGDFANWQLFLVSGLLGGLTTFSAFGLETVALMKAGNMATAAMYVFATLAAGFIGVFVGIRFAGA